MSFLRFLKAIAWIGLISSPMPAMAACSVVNAVAKITLLDAERQGDVRITRSGQERAINARLNHYLCEGDRLVRTNQAKVSLQWNGSASHNPMTEPSITIEAPKDWRLLRWVQEQAGRFFGGGSEVAPPVRSASAVGRGEGGDISMQQRREVLFSHGYGAEQLIAPTREVISVSWRGSPLWVRLIAEDGTVLSSTTPYGQPWTSVILPRDVSEATLTFEQPSGQTQSIRLLRDESLVGTNGQGSNGGIVFGSLEWAAENAFADDPRRRLEAEIIIQALSGDSLIASDLWNRVGTEAQH